MINVTAEKEDKSTNIEAALPKDSQPPQIVENTENDLTSTNPKETNLNRNEADESDEEEGAKNNILIQIDYSICKNLKSL